MNRLQDKVTIITGAGAGMGKQMAFLFAKEGAKVIATDINMENLEAVKAQIEADGGNVVIGECNIASEADVDATFKMAVDTHGRVDSLINNAGIMDKFDPIADVENSMWERIISVDLSGNFYTMRAACRQFLTQESRGNIVNIGSAAAVAGGRAGAAYTAAKHGMVGLTKNTAHMYANVGIRCNMIAPGSTATEISAGWDISSFSELAQERVFGVFDGLKPRRAEAWEIATLTLFLASDEAKAINGAISLLL
ncbi:MAG: SDR family NAD(P)-dependent oxidoreductase [Pseudomonadota bacterium]